MVLSVACARGISLPTLPEALNIARLVFAKRAFFITPRGVPLHTIQNQKKATRKKCHRGETSQHFKRITL
jgi:hypothetical protein